MIREQFRSERKSQTYCSIPMRSFSKQWQNRNWKVNEGRLVFLTFIPSRYTLIAKNSAKSVYPWQSTGWKLLQKWVLTKRLPAKLKGKKSHESYKQGMTILRTPSVVNLSTHRSNQYTNSPYSVTILLSNWLMGVKQDYQLDDDDLLWRQLLKPTRKKVYGSQ